MDFLLEKIPGTISLGVPLGLGKPNVFLNQLYAAVKAAPSRKLELYTALSLDLPAGGGLLGDRFFMPFLARHFGADYPRLAYLRDVQRDTVPANVEVREFYSQAGQASGVGYAQRNHVSLNYTHVARELISRGLNVVVQLVARDPEGRISLSCNPDTSLDLDEIAKENGRRLFKIAVVHPDLPFLEGDALVPETFFDAILDSPESRHELFALPRLAIDSVSHAVALHASTLVHDGGTIQMGIGSLSDALTHSLLLRQKHNELYRSEVAAAGGEAPGLADLGKFSKGLFGLSEMVMDGFMHLRKGGVLCREVHLGKKTFLQGGFFLGSKLFYEWLRTLPAPERRGIFMSRISRVNDLYDPDETEVRRQRPLARFFNTAMRVNLLGATVSDTLNDGSVVSGVGGQYNFVAMAHELKDARSVILLRSTRRVKGVAESTICLAGGQLTSSRHLRDLVVTEYGVADLRGKTDEECVKAMIAVADSRFQPALAETAKKARKLSESYAIPESVRQNTPEKIRRQFRASEAFPAYPFGSDFTPEEERLAEALAYLQKLSAAGALKLLIQGGLAAKFAPELERMGMRAAKGIKERLLRRMLLAALSAS